MNLVIGSELDELRTRVTTLGRNKGAEMWGMPGSACTPASEILFERFLECAIALR